MKAKRSEFLKIFEILTGIKGKQDKTFGMYVNLNIKKFESFAKETQTIFQNSNPSPKFQEYITKEADLIKQYCEKDDNDGPKKVGPNAFVIKKEYIDVYTMGINQLKDEYKEAIDEQTRVAQERDKLLDEEIEIKLSQIPFSAFPEEFDREKMMELLPIIKDFEE